MKIFKSLCLIIIAVLIGFGAGSYFTSKKLHKNESIAFINSMLYDLNIELDLLEHWKANYQNDQILEENIKHSILNKTSVIAAVDPDVYSLQGVPLEALERLISLNDKGELVIPKYEKAFNITSNYLSSIEQDVISILEKRKEVHKNPLK